MGSTLLTNITKWIKRWNIPLIIQLWIFTLIILFFQLLWKKFEVDLNTFPPFVMISDFVGDILLISIPALINPLFTGEVVRSGISLILPDGLYINYLFYLSGVKQICLVVILFILVQGPWRKKLWFIPMSIGVILITVFLRFLLLTVHCMTVPEHIYLLQDLIIVPILYAEILVMWMAWVLLIAKTASLRIYPAKR